MKRSPKTTINEWKGIIKSYLFRFFMLALFWMPMQKRHVMIYNHARKGYCCNPKYLVSALLDRYGSAVKIFWVSEYPETCQKLEEIGVHVIKANTWEHTREYFTSKVYITNDSFPHWARHRKGQLWINVWHGAMNYKRIGYDCLPPMNLLGKKLFRLKNRKPDIFVAGSRFFAENTAEAFGFPANIFLYCGLPRNDIFFQPHGYLMDKTRQKLKLPTGCKVLLYAPTFRDDGCPSAHDIDFLLLQKTLQKRFGGTWKILFRTHSFVHGAEKSMRYAIDVSDYPDMQELLLISDILVSDYSSCMWDFSLLKRPCFVYAPDMEKYRICERDFAYSFALWPYPVARTNEELAAHIMAYDEAVYLKKIEKHHKDAGRMDNGLAAKQLLGKIEYLLG